VRKDEDHKRTKRADREYRKKQAIEGIGCGKNKDKRYQTKQSIDGKGNDRRRSHRRDELVIRKVIMLF